MLSLSEFCYVRLSNGEKKKLPPTLKTTLENTLVLRIQKTWRRSMMYRLWYIEQRIKNCLPITKNTLIYILTRKHHVNRSALSFTNYLHDYFHTRTHIILDDKQIEKVLDIFRSHNNNAHDFFGSLYAMTSKASNLIMSPRGISRILSALEKDILFDMYSEFSS